MYVCMYVAVVTPGLHITIHVPHLSAVEPLHSGRRHRKLKAVGSSLSKTPISVFPLVDSLYVCT